MRSKSCKRIGRWPRPGSAHVRVEEKACDDGGGVRAEREDRLFGSVQGVGVASQRGQSRNSVATGPWRQALTPPFLLLRPAGFCYADGGGRLSQRRRGCWGRRRRRRGGRKVQLARPASLFNVTLCKRQNPGAPELTRARTADAPVASSGSLRGRESRPSFALRRTRSSACSHRSSEPSQEVNPAGGPPSFSAACLDQRRPILSHPPL